MRETILVPSLGSQRRWRKTFAFFPTRMGYYHTKGKMVWLRFFWLLEEKSRYGGWSNYLCGAIKQKERPTPFVFQCSEELSEGRKVYPKLRLVK